MRADGWFHLDVHDQIDVTPVHKDLPRVTISLVPLTVVLERVPWFIPSSYTNPFYYTAVGLRLYTAVLFENSIFASIFVKPFRWLK